jgi:hypothetical protein
MYLECSTHGLNDKFIKKIVVGEIEGKRSLGRSRHGTDNNIKTDLMSVRLSRTDVDFTNVKAT